MGGLDIAGGVALVIAAAMLAVDQTLKSTPDLQSRAPFLELKGKLRWVPIFAIFVAVLLFGIEFLNRTTAQPPSTPAQGSRIGAKEELKLQHNVDFSQKYTSNWSVVGLDLDQIFSSLSDRTSIERSVLLKPYIGKSVIITGTVLDVDRSYLQNHVLSVSLNRSSGGPLASLSFKPGDSIEIIRLKRAGDDISAICKIESLMGGNGLDLRECAIR